MQKGSESKTIPLPKFDGKDKHFTSWWTRFEAYADYHGFSEALTHGEDPDLPAKDSDSIDATTEDGKKQLKAKKHNKLAMASLTMAFNTDGLLNLIHKAKTKEWPKGLAYLVVEAVHHKYQPKDTINLVEAHFTRPGINHDQVLETDQRQSRGKWKRRRRNGSVSCSCAEGTKGHRVCQ